MNDIKTLNQLLIEMENYNNSEVRRAARAKHINVFVFISKDEGEEVDLNGRTPFGDMQTVQEVYERLCKYFGDDAALVYQLFSQRYDEKAKHINASDDYFFSVEEGGHQFKVRVTFWTY